jgi:hypothetical protein
MLPPGVKPNWDDNGPQVQANILAFHQIRQFDDREHDAQLVGARTP